MEKNNRCVNDLYTLHKFSFPVSNAAEISGTASDVTNVKQIFQSGIRYMGKRLF